MPHHEMQNPPPDAARDIGAPALSDAAPGHSGVLEGEGARSGLLVDVFVEPGEREAFQRRQEALWKTVAYYGLDVQPVLLVGGSAFAAQGADTYVTMSSDQRPFDVDILDLRSRGERTDNPLAYTPYNETEGILPVVVAGSGDTVSRSALRGAVTVNGILCTSAAVAAWNKAFVDGRPKDLAGLVKAQVVGSAEGREFARDPAWLDSVAHAMACLSATYSEPGSFGVAWVDELIQNRFDHPALNTPDLSGLYREQLEQERRHAA